MRIKKVNRYWCDFCNKAGLQAGAMRKHELHCTLNINRKCRVCDLLVDDDHASLDELIAMLPDSVAYNQSGQPLVSTMEETTHYKLAKEIECVLPSFRIAAGNCPACMLAALRIKKIPVPMVDDFDFASEMKSVLAAWNERQRDDRGY